MWGEKEDAHGVTSSIINGDVARIGTNSFDVMMPVEPDAAVPRERLWKSRMRKAAPTPSEGTTFEIVDTSLWSFSGTQARQAVDVPFHSAADAAQRPTAGRGSSYGAAPLHGQSESVFVPSSPRIVCASVRNFSEQ